MCTELQAAKAKSVNVLYVLKNYEPTKSKFTVNKMTEPHPSGTALCRCVCIRTCLRPYTVNFKCAFKYFPKIERPRATARGQRWQP